MNRPALAALLALPACDITLPGFTPDDPGADSAQDTGAPFTPTGAVPEAFADLPGTWEDLGPAPIDTSLVPDLDADPTNPDPRDLGSRTEGEEDYDDRDEAVFRVVDLHAGRQYRVTLQIGDLRAVHDDAVRAGLTEASIPSDAGDGGEAMDARSYRGWSDGVDTRTLRTNTTVWPYRTIGTLYDGGGDCTGTRVGPRHVLTAAHCIYSLASGSFGTIDFQPGRNGEVSEPYGSTGPHWYWIPEEYIDNAPGLNGYDIGVIVLDEPVGNGWMGYGAWSGSFLADKNLYMRGYPRCAVEGSPLLPTGADCDPKTLWGDVATCEQGAFFNQDSAGWNREILTNCDGSAGQSGSSFYFYSPTTGNPVTMGVFSHHYCLGACDEDSAQYSAFPNVITRITPYYSWVISWFRAAYPS